MTKYIAVSEKQIKEWLDKLRNTLSTTRFPIPLVLEVTGDLDCLLCSECQVLKTIGKKCELHA